jgi:hypothetical protein
MASIAAGNTVVVYVTWLINAVVLFALVGQMFTGCVNKTCFRLVDY